MAKFFESFFIGIFITILLALLLSSIKISLLGKNIIIGLFASLFYIKFAFPDHYTGAKKIYKHIFDTIYSSIVLFSKDEDINDIRENIKKDITEALNDLIKNK